MFMKTDIFVVGLITYSFAVNEIKNPKFFVWPQPDRRKINLVVLFVLIPRFFNKTASQLRLFLNQQIFSLFNKKNCNGQK